MPSHDEVPIFSLSIDPAYFKALNSDLPASGRGTSYPATLVYGNRLYSGRGRYRGGGYWHWERKQKSWRFNLDKKQMINRAARINLVNPKTILSFNEVTSMYLAKQAGLLAPICLPMKFVQNREYMGFYNYLEQVDEYFIRRHKRIPGTIYDGDYGGTDKLTGAPTLWKDERYWTQVYTAFGGDADEREDIAGLIGALEDPCLSRFYVFSKNHLDIETYCSYASFDSIVGSYHHSFNQNNKFAFDPITGRFLAIPWDIHVWNAPGGIPNHEYDPSANALLYKWKLVPLFEYERQKRLWELINGPLSKEKILTRLEEDYKTAYPIIRSDKYRDGIFTSFNILEIPSIAVRPSSMKNFNSEYERYRNAIIKRNEFLRQYLSESTAEVATRNSEELTQLIIQAFGTVGVRLREIILCADANALRIYKDINRDGILDEEDEFLGYSEAEKKGGVFGLDELIFPGFKLVPHDLARHMYGTHSLVPSPLLYSFLITGGEVNDIELVAENPVTGESVAITHVKQVDYSKARKTASIHPWDIPKPLASENIFIGPGVVMISEAVAYPEHATVNIRPGTELRMSEGASLIFRGRVVAEGTEEEPIVITASDADKPWGTFALQGKSTSGSVFKYCLWDGGSKGKEDLIHYPAMLCIHDANNVVIRNCVLTNNRAGSVGMRVGYGNVSIEGCFFTDLKDSALKVDASEAAITSCDFRDCEGKAIDSAMGSIFVDKCLFKNITEKALLAREDSFMRVSNSVFAETVVSVEAQDASNIEFINAAFYKSSTAISTTKGIYPEGPKITSDEIFVYSCNQVFSEKAASEINIGKVTNVAFNSELAQFDQGKKLRELINYRADR